MSRGKRNGTYALCEPAGDLLCDAAAELAHLLADGLEGAALAELHEDLDLARGRGHVRAIELDDVDVRCRGYYLDFAQELLHRRLEGRDCLSRHDLACPHVPHRVHSAAGALTEPSDLLEHVIGPLIELLDSLAQILH